MEKNTGKVREFCQSRKVGTLFLIEHMNPSCKLFSAITYYRKAVQLVPDIEFRLADFQQVKKKRRGKINSLSFYGPMDYFNFRTA